MRGNFAPPHALAHLFSFIVRYLEKHSWETHTDWKSVRICKPTMLEYSKDLGHQSCN
jgi:hypothetical protein